MLRQGRGGYWRVGDMAFDLWSKDPETLVVRISMHRKCGF